MDISISKDIEPLSEFRKKSADFIKRLKKDKQPYKKLEIPVEILIQKSGPVT